MKTLKQQLGRKSVTGVLFTLPFTIEFLLFMLVPMEISLYCSFCGYDMLSLPVLTGLKNPTSIFQDGTFFKTLKAIFFFASVLVPLKPLFTLIVAMLLLGNSKISGFYRTTHYPPSIVGGSVVVSTLWKRVFAMDGVVNKFLGMAGIQASFSWLGDTRTAIWVLILLMVRQFGSSTLIFLSSLRQIPQSLYEAAKADGANAPAKFSRITLLLLTPIIFLNLVMQMANGFLTFTQCYITTQRKPMNSTPLYAVYMRKQPSEFYNTGHGTAFVWVVLAVIGLITPFLFVTKRSWIHEGGL